MRTAERLQKQYAAYITAECMTGDHEADHKKADDAIIKYLRVIGCGDLADAWEKVGKWYGQRVHEG
jgi:hypothetical protein